MKIAIATIAFIVIAFLATSPADAGLIGRVLDRVRSVRPMQRVSQRIAERPRRIAERPRRLSRVRILPRNRG